MRVHDPMTKTVATMNLVATGGPMWETDCGVLPIEEALERSAEIDARRISVSAIDGKIHPGSFRSRAEREEAEHAAWDAPGVTDVIDHITVVP